MAANDLGDVHPLTAAEWRAWLERHHADAPGIWCVFYKKHTGKPAVGYDEAVSEALCFGWVDSLPRKLDDQRHMLLFTPRKPGSNWSGPNKRRIVAMEKAAKMTPTGRAAVEAAKADGSWSALDAVERLEVPADLAAAFEQHPPAAERWAAFPPSARRGILEWIINAKRPATRTERVEKTATLAAKNERANQWRR